MKLCGGTRSCWQCQIWMLRRIGTYKIHSSHPAWQLRAVFSFPAHGYCPWQPHAGPSILARVDIPGSGGPPAVNGGPYGAAQMAVRDRIHAPGLAGATPAGASSPYSPNPNPRRRGPIPPAATRAAGALASTPPSTGGAWRFDPAAALQALRITQVLCHLRGMNAHSWPWDVSTAARSSRCAPLRAVKTGVAAGKDRQTNLEVILCFETAWTRRSEKMR